jgi:hypothetical protein
MSTTKHNFLVISIAALVSCSFFFINRKKQPVISASVFESRPNRWGYDILVDGKLFIHQSSCPVVSGNQGFVTAQQAERTAALIINKMKHGLAPSVTTFDLKKIGVE